MTEYGATDAGFVIKPLDVIIEELGARQRGDIDPLWNTDEDELAGQINGIMGDQFAQLWEVLEDLSTALSRDADGQALDAIGDLTGTPRQGARKARVTLTLTLDGGVTVPAGSIVSQVGDPSVRVLTLLGATNFGATPAAVTAGAEAETAGAITANAGTLTTIETPVSGWSAVTNIEPLGGGANIELDPAYRQRQVAELAVTGGGTVDGIRADLMRVEGVTAAFVIENTEDEAVSGMPPKSIEAIVLGGAPADIAESIWSNKAGGIFAHGTEPAVPVLDDQGFTHDVRFSRPTPVDAYVAIEVEGSESYDPVAGAALIKNALALAAVTPGDAGYLNIGTNVYAGRMICTIIEIDGVLNATVGLAFSVITDSADGAAALDVASREIATLLVANMRVDGL